MASPLSPIGDENIELLVKSFEDSVAEFGLSKYLPSKSIIV